MLRIARSPGVGAKSCLSLWERWHRAAMTERVEKTPEAVFSLRGPVQGKNIQENAIAMRDQAVAASNAFANSSYCAVV